MKNKFLICLISVILIIFVFSFDVVKAEDIFELVARENIKNLESLIEDGVDINEKNESGRTALMEAVDNNSLEIVEILIEAEADINIKTEEGITALLLATVNNNLEVIETLIQAGAKINSGNEERTPVVRPIENQPEIELEITNISERHIDLFKEELSYLINSGPIYNYAPGYVAFDGETMGLTTVLYGDFSDLGITLIQGSKEFFALETSKYLRDYAYKAIARFRLIQIKLSHRGIDFFPAYNDIVLYIDETNYLIIPARTSTRHPAFMERLYLVLDGKEYDIKNDFLRLDMRLNDYAFYPEGSLTDTDPPEGYKALILEFLSKSSSD